MEGEPSVKIAAAAKGGGRDRAMVGAHCATAAATRAVAAVGSRLTLTPTAATTTIASAALTAAMSAALAATASSVRGGARRRPRALCSRGGQLLGRALLPRRIQHLLCKVPWHCTLPCR